MRSVFDFHRGTTPVLVNMPHSGTDVPDDVVRRFTDRARQLPDTDWHVPRLYDFAEALGASVLRANFSRYVIDLNRPPDDASLYPGQVKTGLFPERTFDDSPIYSSNQEPTEAERVERHRDYWKPYHEKLAAELAGLKARFGYALLYDAHSIASHVPRLFPGRLPDLNLGTMGGRSCAVEVERAIATVMAESDFSQVINGRFLGGYITRHYGDPANGIHAVQMELAQSAYMDEIPEFPFNEGKAARLRPVLRRVLQTYLESAPG